MFYFLKKKPPQSIFGQCLVFHITTKKICPGADLFSSTKIYGHTPRPTASTLPKWDLSRCGKEDLPWRKRSTCMAHSRPSAIAQTTKDCPRLMSPAKKTPGRVLWYSLDFGSEFSNNPTSKDSNKPFCLGPV